MTSRSGGLLELVARGKKDLYFTSNPKITFFHSVYSRAAPFTKEIYVSAPRNVPDWGHYVDFDIDHRGDLLKQIYLRITLPTWLPSDSVAANLRGVVTDQSGVTFGYCNNVGFQIIDCIQFFQDQLLICESYGEYLDWRLRQSYSLATTYLVAGEVGTRDETALGIARSATLPTLRVPIPLLGWQHLEDPGLPLCALRNQRFRLRIHLRRLAEVVVASDGRLAPAPWGGKPFLVQAERDGPVTTVASLPESDLKLHVALEQTVVYVPADVQTWFRAQTLRFPFTTTQFEQFTLEDNVMTAAAVNPAGTYPLPLNLDFIGSVDRLLLGFRSEASSRAGQRTALRAPNGAPFIRTVRLNIANLDRIKQATLPEVREFTAYWKSARLALDLADPSQSAEIYTLTFGDYDWRVPAGTLQFTRAVLPVLYLTLNAVPYDTRNISRRTFALLYADSWNVFEISGGKGKMMFDDS